VGKVRIVSGGEEGNYQVQRVYDEKSLEVRKNLLQAKITSLTEENAKLETEIAELQEKYAEAANAYNAALWQFIQALRSAAAAGEEYPTNDYGYAEKYGEAYRLNAEMSELKRTKALNDIGIEKANQTLASLNALKDPPIEQAWCADFTEDATGELASIEVPGEPQKLLVYPQARNQGAHSPSRDGILMPRLWATPEQAYWCAAVLPGWQRWKPTYRTGTITAIDYENDTCTISIGSAVSSAQSLEINPVGGTIFEGVPIEYMLCNAGAFEVDDKVVVQFDNQWYWDEGKVIGFAENPKPCITFYCHMKNEGPRMTHDFCWTVRTCVDWGNGSFSFLQDVTESYVFNSTQTIEIKVDDEILTTVTVEQDYEFRETGDHTCDEYTYGTTSAFSVNISFTHPNGKYSVDETFYDEMDGETALLADGGGFRCRSCSTFGVGAKGEIYFIVVEYKNATPMGVPEGETGAPILMDKTRKRIEYDRDGVKTETVVSSIQETWWNAVSVRTEPLIATSYFPNGDPDGGYFCRPTETVRIHPVKMDNFVYGWAANNLAPNDVDEYTTVTPAQ
jgi:cell division protein FtsB